MFRIIIKNNFIDNEIEEKICNFNKYTLKKIKDLLDDNSKIIKYGDIYAYLYRKNKKTTKNLYPDYINNIKDKNKRDNKKCIFRRGCKNYTIDKNSRLNQKRNYKDIFDGKMKEDNFLILTKSEFYDILYIIHNKNGHKGYRFIINEFNRRRLYYHDLTTNIKNYIDKCKICVENKLNNYIKPTNKQIISRFPLERVLMDITYFSYKNNNIKINKTYI